MARGSWAWLFVALSLVCAAAPGVARAQDNPPCDSRGLKRITGTTPCPDKPVTNPDGSTTPATGVRAALVIGQSDYRTAGDAATSVGDAARVAAALSGAGWQVTSANNLDAASLDSTVRRFAASLQAGDAALVYFSGLAAKGAAVAAGSGTENYLLGTDAAANGPADIARTGMPLSTILSRLAAAHAGAQVIILDAARPNRLEPGWSAPVGLAEPASAALANAVISFPAIPGRLARESLFVPALVEAIAAPGASASQLSLDLSSRVDRTTGGQQTPWYSGSSASSRMVVGPLRGSVGSEGGAATDASLRAQAIACGTGECLTQAAGRAHDATIAIDLLLRSEVAGAESVEPAAPPPPAPGKAPSGGAGYVEAFIESNKASPDGMRRIGIAFQEGSGGFPKSADQAYVWLIRGASAGDGEAAWRLADFFQFGKPPVGHVDLYAAVMYYKQAAQQGVPGAEYALGLAYARGEGGLPVDPAASAEWLAKAKAAGWQAGQ